MFIPPYQAHLTYSTHLFPATNLLLNAQPRHLLRNLRLSPPQCLSGLSLARPVRMQDRRRLLASRHRPCNNRIAVLQAWQSSPKCVIAVLEERFAVSAATDASYFRGVAVRVAGIAVGV
jgi:hypothetical protein